MMGNLALAVPTVSGELLPSWQSPLAGGKSGGGTLRRHIGVRVDVGIYRRRYNGRATHYQRIRK